MTEDIHKRVELLEQLVRSLTQDNIPIIDPPDAYTHLQRRVAALENQITSHRLILQDIQRIRRRKVTSPSFARLPLPHVYSFDLTKEVVPNQVNKIQIGDEDCWMVPEAGAYTFHIDIELDAYKPNVPFQQMQLKFGDETITASNDPVELAKKYWESDKSLHLNITRCLQGGDAAEITFLYRSSAPRTLKNSSVYITKL